MSRTLSASPDRKLRTALRQCGLTAVALKSLMERRPFEDDAMLCAAVDDVILRLDDTELRKSLEAESEPVVEHGDVDARDAALLALRLYRDRFGYPYVSSITAPDADELLMRVRIRLGNEPAPEGRAAREHLRRLVRARMQAHMQSAE